MCSSDLDHVKLESECSRRMFPLRLSWAWTIHKAQGQTMTGKVVVNLGTKELADGLSYVAISRVNSIANLGHYGLGMDRLTAEIRKRKGIYVRLLGEKQMCHKALATAESCSNSPDMQPHMGYIRQTIHTCETCVIQALAAIHE